MELHRENRMWHIGFSYFFLRAQRSSEAQRLYIYFYYYIYFAGGGAGMTTFDPLLLCRAKSALRFFLHISDLS